MSHSIAIQDQTGNPSTDEADRQHAGVVMTRCTVLIGAAYLVLYGNDAQMAAWQQIAMVAVLMLSLSCYGLAVRSGQWERLRWPITLADLALVTVAVAFTGESTNDFFLFFFLVLIIAGISSQFGHTVIATLLVCAVYVGMLYAEHGHLMWRQTDLLIRLPFLFGVGLFFGTISDEARREQHRYHRMTDVNRKMVHRYHQVASERDRTKALLEIGQLALSAGNPQGVLHAVNMKLRETLRAERCSTLVFNEGERHAYLAACSDEAQQADGEQSVQLLLALKHYPELEETLSSGEITELHPNEPSKLWEKVRLHLPMPHRFRSWFVVPVMHNETVVGAFFLRDAREDFTLQEEERTFCKAAALMVAGYLQGCDLVEEMRRRTRLDGLTGLLNFNTFRQELDQELLKLGEQQRPKPISLVMVDIDNLKTINDHHGHVIGNQVIREVGQRLARALPMAQSICRYGGDEFFALVPLDKKTAIERAERVLILLEDLPPEIPCPVRVSIGVATFPEDGEVADSFMDAADRAMYVAKGEGGNQIHSAGAGEDSDGRVYQAMISVNARRLMPGEGNALRQVLDSMLRDEEQELDSAAVQQSLRALMEAVESKDSYTREHSLEVSDLTRRLCEAVGLNEREALAVEVGALVHDIGKVGIPDEILQKPGALTTRERMQIEQHPEIGAQILKPLPALKDVVPLVLHHHERWDGTGYPHGLVGEEIPVGSQIISLCDVWHALTSDRSYRPAFSHEVARDIITEGRGAEWPAELVDAFFVIIEEMRVEEKRNRIKKRRSA